jgi:hypothetical protein
LILKARIALTGLLLAATLVGCSSNVTLQTPTIPRPLTEKMPVSIGLRMPPNFQSFVHEEEVYGRSEWTIDLGNANAALFTQLFGFMFEKVTVLNPDDDPQLLDIDALIEPSIDAFEFAIPNQSNSESFAVWVRYRLRVYDAEGTLVSNWPVSAYGKSETESLSNSEALKRAAILAMRDAAALIIMKLDATTGISAMADRETPAAAPAIEVPPAAAAEDDVQATIVEE